MANLKYTVVWLVLVLVHFNPQFVGSTPIPLTTSNAAQTNPPPTAPNLVLCPHFPPAECPPEEVWDNECMTDRNCTEMHPGHQFKCCDVGCQYRCIPPAKVKLPTFLPQASLQVKGTCPVFPAIVECPEHIYDECIDDQQCDEIYPGIGFKCCQDECGMLCLPPEQETTPTTRPPTYPSTFTCPHFPPAECPPEKVWDNKCMTDMNCTEMHPGKELKCCDIGCQFKCIPPVKVMVPFTQPVTMPVHGACPVLPTPDECPPEPELQIDPECVNDQECAKLYPGRGMKCCRDGCDKRCVAPVARTTPTPRPLTSQVNFTCPFFTPGRNCPPEEDLDHECTDDAKCIQLYPGKGLKCCKDGCYNICVAPVDANAPTTPPPKYPFRHACPVLPPAGCPPDEDHECRTDLKCAELYPGHLLKCCMEGCEYRCMTPVIERYSTIEPFTIPVNGTCPVFPTSDECPPDPDDECNNDQKCDVLYPGQGLKCCQDGCDMRCVAPVE